MQLGLVDVLQCPRSHEPSALVATVERTASGSVVDGMLACPICDARYVIEHGSVVFSPAQRDRSRALPGASPPSPEAVLRAAALLDLVEPGGLVVLGGTEGALAEALRERADVAVVILNPPGAIVGWSDVTPVYADALPFAPGVLRGALLDAETGSSAGGIVEAVRAGGHLIAPASVALPVGVRELARDSEVWVAQRESKRESAPVTLRRASN